MESEKRLIDANALTDALRTNEGANALGHSVHRLFCVDEIIDKQPTVDAVEVVHGRWVGHYDGSWIHKRKWLTGYDCSVCGKFINTMTLYCPYCGAKMDGDGNV